ncbi:hypothetical protein [Streptomyces sp. NPDC052179]|uniref:hypothetical protein n=1 Tax=Streptomyces sp. NPDC052179 TaxID=3155680 RepID=UPI003432392E
MKRVRSTEESEPARNRGEAVGTPAPDSEALSGAPGSIGAPSSPPSPTSTEGGDGGITGGRDIGGARTPTASKPGPEKPDEPAAETPAVVHAAGVSIGRGTSGSERRPDGESAAAAEEEPAPTAGKVAAVPTTGSGSATPSASSGAAESAVGEPAEAKTPPATAASAPAEPATAASTPASEPSASGTTAAAAEATGSATETVSATTTASATATAVAAASSGPPGGASAAEGGAPERPGRVSRPMVVAAAFAGALLLATPFVVAGAQKDEAKPKSREEAAAWKADGRAGGYVPGTDPDRTEGKRQAGGDDPGKTPARLDKGTGTGGDVRADSGVGGKSADGSTGTKDKGTKGEGDKASKSGTGDKAPDPKSSKTPAKAPAAGTAPKSAPTVVYSGVSGPECDTQRFQKSGYYSDGKEGWATHTGGFGGYGCDGKYLSMPMSGSSSKDSGGSATWLFDLPDSARKCSISVHVPGSSDIVRVGGNPSYYTVYDRFLPRTSNLVGSYYVRQKERRGTWYNVPGTFAVDAKKLSVQLHDRGEDNNYEHHAISALKVTCTG